MLPAESARVTNTPHLLTRDEGQRLWFLGTLMVIKSDGALTSGGFGLLEQVLPPGFMPPLHVHHGEDEAFYVLEGRITFHCGDRSFPAATGSFVYLPRDIPHWFRVEGEQPARLLEWTIPGGVERYFVENGTPASALPLPPPAAPDVQRLIATAAAYNVEILGPPPAE